MMKNKVNVIFAMLSILGVCFSMACGQANKENKMNKDTTVTATLPDAKNFQEKINGKETSLYILENKNKVKAAFTNFGGRLVSLLIPDASGKMTDVVVGFDSLATYQSAKDYYGASVGRYGNRIANAQFSLKGKLYTLPANNGPNTLHGGTEGFDSKVWDVKQLNKHALEISYFSADGEEGFPGNLTVNIVYELLDDNSLKISYQASTDKETVVNLTNHAYWNLNGSGSGTILNHRVQIDADAYTPVDTTLIPTGQLVAVSGTPFDFRNAMFIGSRIKQSDEQLKNGKGYDHNYVLNQHDITKPIATVIGDKSGIVMQVYTTEPGVQFYSGNFMKGESNVKGGGKNDYRTGFCLETQHFPDSPNQPKFPSTVLKPGELYKTETIYKFSMQK